MRESSNGALIWNNHPAPDDEATWSGGRDDEGYAHGMGTLTWWKRGQWTSKYTGWMNRGLFEGRVENHDSDGEKFAGTFVRGKKQPDWRRVTTAEAVENADAANLPATDADPKEAAKEPAAEAKQTGPMTAGEKDDSTDTQVPADPFAHLTHEYKRHLLGAIATNLNPILAAISGGGRDKALAALEELCPASDENERMAVLIALHHWDSDELIAIRRKSGREAYIRTLYGLALLHHPPVAARPELRRVIEDFLDLVSPF